MNFLSLYKRQLLYFLKTKIDIDKDKKDKSISLEDLLVKYGSDKASFFNKKNNGHGYTKFYLKHFNKIKKKKIKYFRSRFFFRSLSSSIFKIFFKCKYLLPRRKHF